LNELVIAGWKCVVGDWCPIRPGGCSKMKHRGRCSGRPRCSADWQPTAPVLRRGRRGRQAAVEVPVCLQGGTAVDA
jgi:hypothetical protein